MYKSVLNVCADVDGQELRTHGTFAYPVACYFDDMSKATVISHWHNELELIIVTEGKLLVGAAQTEKILTAGDGCFINANVLHDVRQIDSAAGVLKSIVFHPRIVGNRADVFWIKFLQPLLGDTGKQVIFFDGKKDSQTVSLIAAAASLSKSEAHRCFKRATGLPAIQFLIRYRILLAAERLHSTRQSISDVAASCGFLDMSYFSKAFRETFKATPTDYRKNLEMIS